MIRVIFMFICTSPSPSWIITIIMIVIWMKVIVKYIAQCYQQEKQTNKQTNKRKSERYFTIFNLSAINLVAPQCLIRFIAVTFINTILSILLCLILWIVFYDSYYYLLCSYCSAYVSAFTRNNAWMILLIVKKVVLFYGNVSAVTLE